MTQGTHSELEAFFQKHGVRDVECLFPDVWGYPRGKPIPASSFAAGSVPRGLVGFGLYKVPSRLNCSVACTSARLMPGSKAPCPASGTMQKRASGQAWCRRQAVRGGHTMS